MVFGFVRDSSLLLFAQSVTYGCKLPQSLIARLDSRTNPVTISSACLLRTPKIVKKLLFTLPGRLDLIRCKHQTPLVTEDYRVCARRLLHLRKQCTQLRGLECSEQRYTSQCITISLSILLKNDRLSKTGHKHPLAYPHRVKVFGSDFLKRCFCQYFASKWWS